MIGQLNPTQLSSRLAAMSDQQLQQYAMLHHDDPFVMAIAMDVKNQRDAARSSVAAPSAAQPTVVNQLIARMAQLPPMQGAQGQQMPAQQLAQPPQPQGAPPQQAADGGLMHGIARLPARNLTRMAEGGIVGYADGGAMSPELLDFAQRGEPVLRMASGTNPLQQYADLIRTEALQQGVDPDLAMRLFMAESGGKPNAVSSAGAVGLGQLKEAAAKDMGLSPEERTDPVKNIRASIGYLAKQQQKYGGDPEKALAAYNWGPGNVDKHLDKNQGNLNRFGLPKETAAYLNKLLPIGSAQAAPQTAPPTPAGQIPGAAPGQVALSATPQQSGYLANFGKGLVSLADVALSPVAFGVKQIGYAASRPFLSAAEAEKLSSETAAPFQDMLGKTFGVTQDPAYQQEITRRAVTAFGTKVDEGSKWLAGKLGIPEQDAANMMNTVIAAGPKVVPSGKAIAQAGEAAYAKLRPETGKVSPQQAARIAEQNRFAEIERAKREAMGAGATLEEQSALEKMIAERQQAEAPSAAYALQQKQTAPPPGRLAAVGAATSKATSAATPFLRDNETGYGGTAPVMPQGPARPESERERARMMEANQMPSGTDVATAAKAVDTATKALSPEQRKGMGWEDLMMFGFALMAGKSPYAMQNVGEAGLIALKGKQEREKAMREERQSVGKEALEAAQAKYYEQYAGAIERGAKEKNDYLAAEKMVQDALAKWESSLAGKTATIGDPNARAAEEARLRQNIYSQLGLDVTKIAGAPTAGTGGGFKVVGVRNP